MFLPLEGFSISSFADLKEKLGEINVFTLLGINVALVAALIFSLATRNKTMKWDTRKVVYGALLISLAFVLSYVRFLKLPQGGSVTAASMLPIMAYGYMFGPLYGCIVGLAYGILQAIQDPYIVGPIQFILDYPLAFMFLGLMPGLLKTRSSTLNLFLGMIAAALLRYLCHAISGYLFFGEYAEPGYSALAWGFVYNSFVFVDLAICLIVAAIPQLRHLFDRIRLRSAQ